MAQSDNPSLKTSRIIKCPSCRRPTKYSESNPYRPFCSNRCQLQDTAAWAEESYRVPGQPVDPWAKDSEQNEDDS